MNFEGKQQSLLTFRVGPVLCCAPSLPVRSIISPPKLTHLPGSDSSQPGVFKHGSHIVKVLDLRQKFGIEQSEQTQPGNLIITIFETESFAFWVDQILDVFDFPSEGWGDLPAAIPRGVFTRTLLLNKKIHLYSEFEKLATISDLGYLKHYIQQLKKQQDEKETEKTEEKPTLKNSSSVKSSEIKHNPIVEVKKSQPIKSDTSTEVKKTLSNSSDLSRMATISESDNKKPIIKPKQTSVTQSKVTKPIVTTTTQTQKQKQKQKQQYIKKEPNKIKPAVIVEEKNNITKQSYSSPTSTMEDKSSSFGIIFLLFFILFALGAGTYSLFIYTTGSDSDDEYAQEQTSISSQPQVDYSTKDEPVLKDKPILEEIISNQDDINSIKETIIVDKEVEENNKPLHTKNQEDITEIIPIEKTAIENKDSSITKNGEDAAYRAEIVQQDNDIIITLHQPIAEEKPEQEEITITPLQPDNVVIEKVVESPSVKELKKEELQPNLKPKIIINEVIHTVVKGDTLWAIAKKYVNDPFLYPELARLSNIKNPHRIYPGNRVRIRFIKN